MTEGVDGLLRDKARPARVPKLTDDVAERIVTLTLDEPPGSPPPHCIRTFKLSNDLKFAAFDVLGGKVIGRCM